MTAVATPALPPVVCGRCASGLHNGCTGRAIRWVDGRSVSVPCTCDHDGEVPLW